MADEKVNLTIGVTDEVSAPLKDLARNFDQYRSRLREVHEGQTGILRVLLREVEQVNHNMAQSRAHLQTFGHDSLSP